MNFELTTDMNTSNEFRVAHEINQVSVSRLTPLEIDFFFAFVSDIAKEDDVFKEYIITKDVLEKKLDRRLNTNRTRDLLKRLLNKSIWLEDEGKMEGLPFFSKLSFNKITNDFIVRFNPELKPFLLKLQVFTLGNTKYLFTLESKYQKQMYLFLSQWRKRGNYTTKLDSLMDSFKVPSSMRAWGEFKRKVLDASAKAFFEKSDIIFEWKVTGKKGRAVDEITFHIQDNPLFKNKKNASPTLFDTCEDSPYESFYGRKIQTRQGLVRIVRIVLVDIVLHVYFEGEDGYLVLPSVEMLEKAIRD